MRIFLLIGYLLTESEKARKEFRGGLNGEGQVFFDKLFENSFYWRVMSNAGDVWPR